MQPGARRSSVTFFFFFCLSFFLGSCKCADAKDVAVGKLGWAGRSYTSSKHSEIIHVLIGIIFSEEITNNFWSLCLGVSAVLDWSKSHRTLHTGSSCAIYSFLPRQRLNSHLLSSCKNHGVSLSSYRANFSISMAPCSLQRGEKRIGSFLKNQACPATGPQAKQSTTAYLFPWVQEKIHVFVLLSFLYKQAWGQSMCKRMWVRRYYCWWGQPPPFLL